MWKVQRQNPKAKSAKSKGKSTREDVGGGGWGLRGWGGVVRGGHYLCGHREVLLRQGSRPDGGVHRTVSGETKCFFFQNVRHVVGPAWTTGPVDFFPGQRSA